MMTASAAFLKFCRWFELYNQASASGAQVVGRMIQRRVHELSAQEVIELARVRFTNPDREVVQLFNPFVAIALFFLSTKGLQTLVHEECSSVLEQLICDELCARDEASLRERWSVACSFKSPQVRLGFLRWFMESAEYSLSDLVKLRQDFLKSNLAIEFKQKEESIIEAAMVRRLKRGNQREVEDMLLFIFWSIAKRDMEPEDVPTYIRLLLVDFVLRSRA